MLIFPIDSFIQSRNGLNVFVLTQKMVGVEFYSIRLFFASIFL